MISDEVLDPETVAELRRAQQDYENPAFISQLVGLFLSNAPRRMAQIREALAARDALTLERVAHTLRSNFGVLGASGMSQACARIEEAGGRSAFDEAERVFAEAELAFPRVLAAVAELGKTAQTEGGEPG